MRKILSYVRPYAFYMSVGMFIKFVGALMDLALPYILAYLIDDVAKQGDVMQIYLWGVVMLICSIIAWVTNIVANRMASKVARDTTRSIRHDLYERINNLSCRQTDEFTIPSLISRLTSDTYNIHRMLGMMQRLGVRAPILLLGGVVVTLIMEPKLALVLVSTLPILAVGVVYISRKGIPMYRVLQTAIDRMVRVVRDNITGIRVIKALSKTEYEMRRFEGVNEEVSRKERRANIVMGATNPLMNLVLNFGLTAVIVTGAFLVNWGQTEPGNIIAFLTLFTIILNALMSINRMFVMYSQASASAQRITQVLDAPMDLETEAPDVVDTGDHIRFENVSFSYNGKQNNLEGIDFALKHGQTLGIMGATGSGKTTLIQLLQRFYPVSGGAIRIDGANVNGIEPKRLHTMFGVAFQSDTLFADTIYENIDFGRNLPKEQIELAARCAQAADFIDKLPDGYQHMLTSKGTNLSGGQKQRLLIARALAGRPEILILDDSSSALDYQTDAKMRRAVREHYPEVTTILIAQRVSSVRTSDLILVLDEGKMLGLGSHQQLMESCEVYRETSYIQMGGGLDAQA